MSAGASLVSQLVSKILPTRSNQNSRCAFRITEYSGNRLNAAPEKEARRKQRRHIASAWREERPATDEGRRRSHHSEAGHKVRAVIVNDVVGPERLDKFNVLSAKGGAGHAPSALAI